jgi:SNF2 family DNA or RNA helicase
MGSIELAVPVGHIWYLRKAPSRIGSLLGIRLTDLEKIVYYARYVVLEDLKGEDGKVKYASRTLLSDEEYHKARQEFGDKLKAGIGADAIRQLLEKIQTGQKIAVYSEWTTMLSIIERHMDKHKIKYSRFDGSLSSITRLKRIEEFQNDPDCSVFFSSDAGGIGIDGLQTICNTIIHTELPWNPAKLDQRNGRLHRIGQTKNVEVHNFVTTDSIETKIEELLINKKKVRMDTLYNVEIQE